MDALEGRALLTTIIPSKGGSAATQAFITKPDLYLLEGTVDTTGVQPKEIFSVTVNLIPNVPTTITVSLASSVSPKIDGYLSLNSGTSNATVTNPHYLGVFNTGPGNDITAPGNNTPTIINFTPKGGQTGYTLTFAVAADNGGYAVTGSLPYAVNLNVQSAVPTPKISLVSFAKDAATSPLNSDGDYDLTYQVSGASLPNNSKLTASAYWATGTTEASIIPNIPPAATSQLPQLSPGTYTFGLVHSWQMINPPAAAKNLIVVFDNNHILPASDETNTVIPLSTVGVNTTGAPSGGTWLNAPLSFELQSFASGATIPAPSASTREQRVYLWLQEFAPIINSTAKAYNISPVAIAGAIAWEALQNVSTTSLRASGVGKVHSFSFEETIFPYDTAPSESVEGNTFLSPGNVIPLPYPKGSSYDTQVQDRSIALESPTKAIQYIAAILNGYTYFAKQAGIDLRTPSILNISILDTLYNGVTFSGTYDGMKYTNQSVTLAFASIFFHARATNLSSQPLAYGPEMGQWVYNNVTYLEDALK